jgi:heme oxygenase
MGEANGIHSSLRQRTRAFHEALECKLHVLMSDEISLDQYKTVQKKFYGFYKPVEERLGAVGGWDDPALQLQKRLKLPLLAGDLAFLAMDSGAIAGLPNCECLPRLGNVAEVLGCLYVLEGSTLGGRIITGHLKKVLSLDENRGCSFFNGYGDDTLRMWSLFLGILACHCEEHGDGEIVIDSACRTFSSLDQWLSNVA